MQSKSVTYWPQKATSCSLFGSALILDNPQQCLNVVAFSLARITNNPDEECSGCKAVFGTNWTEIEYVKQDSLLHLPELLRPGAFAMQQYLPSFVRHSLPGAQAVFCSPQGYLLHLKEPRV
jgi:hypothetical protein